VSTSPREERGEVSKLRLIEAAVRREARAELFRVTGEVAVVPGERSEGGPRPIRVPYRDSTAYRAVSRKSAKADLRWRPSAERPAGPPLSRG